MIKRTTLEGIDQATSLPEDTSVRSTRLTTYFWLLIVIWTIIIICLFALDFLQAGRVQREMAKAEASAGFNKDQAFRFWAAKHGGVYVPINSRTPSNPFLSHVPERDITTGSGKALTLMNPAYMLRQMMEEYEDLFGIRGHITSLKHYRPETAPDEWERSALAAFERGDKETIEFTEIEGKPYFRLMRPMIAKRSCLKCHAKQGYKVGDVRGGVSISVPMTLYVTNRRKVLTNHALALGLLWLFGIAGIVTATRGLRNRIRERDRAEAELQKAHDGLEMRVEERTAELKKEIKERKQAGESLLIAHSDLEQIFNAAVPLCTIDKDFNILRVNDTFCSYFHMKKENVIGKKCYDIWKGPFCHRPECAMTQISKGDPRYEYEVNRELDDGTKICCIVTAIPYTSPAGEIIGIIENFTDLTTRKQAEEALQESEERYRTMMEAMIEPIYICSQDFRVEYMNPAMIKRTGRDATGEHCFKALHDLDKKCPWCMHHKTQHGKYLDLEIVSPKDNRSYYVSQTPVTHGDGSLSKLTIFRDITDFKTLETQLQQAQKMEAIGTLAGGIAHDFNNILGGILGYAELAKMKAPEGSEVAADLDSVIKSSNRAADLIKQILTISRQHKQERRPVQVRYIVNEALDLLRAIALR